jgi:hypothetical protein
MVEKYHFDRKVIQEKLGRLEKVVAEEGQERPVVATEADVPASEHVSAGAEPATQTPPSRTDNYSIANLFRRNDLLHLNSQSENRRRHLMERGAMRSERSLPAAGGEPARRSVSLPSEGSSPRRSTSTPAAMAGSGRKTTDDRRRLEGTLTFVSSNGEAFGTAKLNGNEYDG